MSQPPRFWARADGARHPMARLLSPLSHLYADIVAGKIAKASPVTVDVPVVCVGNISLGGVGKTPFTDLVVQRLNAMGAAPHILLRGYGGRAKGPLQVRASHTAQDVGDEARMHGARWPVWVARDRPAGAEAAARAGASTVVMDDGFQNPSLHKDLSFLLIDAVTGFGNGLVFPAGPLRERPEAAFERADCVVLVHGDDPAPSPVAELIPADLPLLNVHLTAAAEGLDPDEPLFAFAGIGRPEKFFASLSEAGLTLIDSRGFDDHHPYTPADIADLKSDAHTARARLVTTTKDYARLSPELSEGILPIPARMIVDDMALLDSLLDPIAAKSPAL